MGFVFIYILYDIKNKKKHFLMHLKKDLLLVVLSEKESKQHFTML